MPIPSCQKRPNTPLLTYCTVSNTKDQHKGLSSFIPCSLEYLSYPAIKTIGGLYVCPGLKLWKDALILYRPIETLERETRCQKQLWIFWTNFWGGFSKRLPAHTLIRNTYKNRTPPSPFEPYLLRSPTTCHYFIIKLLFLRLFKCEIIIWIRKKSKCVFIFWISVVGQYYKHCTYMTTVQRYTYMWNSGGERPGEWFPTGYRVQGSPRWNNRNATQFYEQGSWNETG